MLAIPIFPFSAGFFVDVLVVLKCEAAADFEEGEESHWVVIRIYHGEVSKDSEA